MNIDIEKMNSCKESSKIADLKALIVQKELFIFDLDGTMFNSLGDLAPAVNYALKLFGIQEISKDNVRSCIGNGSRNLIRRSVASGIMYGAGKTAGEPIEGKSREEHLDVRDAEAVAAVLESAGFDEAKIDEVLKTYSGYYWEHCTEETEPYEGVLEFIDWICENDCRDEGAGNSSGRNEGAGQIAGRKIAAMLTNKPVLPAKKILEKFGLLSGAAQNNADAGKECASKKRAGCEHSAHKISYYLCGDTTPERKPGPGGIYAILEKLGVAPEKAVMIGDDTPDVMAAKNAGIDSIICLEGFGRPENLLPLEPKYTIRHIKDLLKLV
ncbi:MAG: HAD-IA family hydrolase [Fibrobacter sp.]|nr:HAD-IA family hydrolase [Fibrobacter sp.]